MKNIYKTLALAVAFLALNLTESIAEPVSKRLQQSFATQALLFRENKGQLADTKGGLRPELLFSAGRGDVQVYITTTGIHYQFAKTIYPDAYKHEEPGKDGHIRRQNNHESIQTATCRLSVSLEGANPNARVSKDEQSGLVENFYLAHCPQGVTGVRSYGRITLHDVYPGIDWTIYSKGQQMKYDFIVHPGADPALIRLKITDAESSTLNEQGELLMKTALGQVVEQAPVSFSGDRMVATRFTRTAEGIIGFSLNDFDASQTLVIDPSIAWATYYGGSGAGAGNEYGWSCAVDDTGNVYVTGNTNSTLGFASTGAHQTTPGYFQADAYLLKFDSSGMLKWATYYGGNEDDAGGSCNTDGNGNVYLAGYTYSNAGIATTAAHQSSLSGTINAFLAKFNSAGLRQWCTYYGGNLGTWGHSCGIDGSGNILMAGSTRSTTGISTTGAHQTGIGGGLEDAFLVKFNSSGVRQWGTYYGGSGDETSYSCAVESNGNVYLTGATSSASGIASAGAYQANVKAGGTDAFLVKFNSSGARVWGTYYGGNKGDYPNSVAADENGHVYIAGTTTSDSFFATSGAWQTANSRYQNAFLVKFDSSGMAQWGTYYGGDTLDYGMACAAGRNGTVWLCGSTRSASGIASAGSHQSSYGGGPQDAFLVQFDSSGMRQWGTYYGGNSDDLGYSCAVSKNGSVYLSGGSISTNGISTAGAYQPNNRGAYDIFLAKFYAEADVSTAVPTPLSRHDIITLYPNPNNGHFTLKAASADAWAGKEVSIALYNTIGQCVYSTSVKPAGREWFLDIRTEDALAAGLYQLKICAGDMEKVLPVLVTK